MFFLSSCSLFPLKFQLHAKRLSCSTASRHTCRGVCILAFSNVRYISQKRVRGRYQAWHLVVKRVPPLPLSYFVLSSEIISHGHAGRFIEKFCARFITAMPRIHSLNREVVVKKEMDMGKLVEVGVPRYMPRFLGIPPPFFSQHILPVSQ